MDPLDDLLKTYAGEPVPKPPARFNADVWSEIKHRQAEHRNSYFGWANFLGRPQLAAAALMVTILVGAAPGFYHDRLETRRKLAREFLHMDIFSPRSASVGASLFQPSSISRGSK